MRTQVRDHLSTRFLLIHESNQQNDKQVSWENKTNYSITHIEYIEFYAYIKTKTEKKKLHRNKIIVLIRIKYK